MLATVVPGSLTAAKNKGPVSVVFALHNLCIINITPLIIGQDFVIRVSRYIPYRHASGFVVFVLSVSYLMVGSGG